MGLPEPWFPSSPRLAASSWSGLSTHPERMRKRQPAVNLACKSRKWRRSIWKSARRGEKPQKTEVLDVFGDGGRSGRCCRKTAIVCG